MRTGRVEAITDASPDAVWAVVSDVTRTGEWSHECRIVEWVGDATPAQPGARFRGRNRMGRAAWTRTSEIVSADAPHELVWRTVPTWLYRDSTEWRIRIEPVEQGTRIVQSFEVLHINPVLDRLFYLLLPPHRDRLPALTQDMRNLSEVASRSPVEV
jgi:hypothetical protein